MDVGAVKLSLKTYSSSSFLLRQKSKMLTSALSDQQARLVLMSRQGALPQDVENEKLVELQLQRKQVQGVGVGCFVIRLTHNS